MPDKAGSFLKASEVISASGGNIVRVSYNKAVDVHTLFIDVSGNEEQIEKITEELIKLGYLTNEEKETKVLLIELKLHDKPGAIKPVLEIISIYNVNISYINSQENGTGYQFFKMGLLIENINDIKNLLDDVSKICDVRILEYDITEKILDSTVFYITFANEIKKMLSLTQEQTIGFLINSNKIMQILDERNEAPLKTFEYIRKFAKFVIDHKAANFNSTVNKIKLSENVTLYLIEPPCGSNTYILENGNELMFIDCGFACFRKEMYNLFEKLFDCFEKYKKSIILTHADIDHSGLLDLFDKIYVSKNSYDNFKYENENVPNYREQNVIHAPYCRLSKIITEYTPPDLNKMEIIGEKKDNAIISFIGELSFSDLNFSVYEGNGGHVKGETIIVCNDKKVIFTGDILVNIKGFSTEQYNFNMLAPYLMTSVNVDSEKSKICRNEVMNMSKDYLICPGHGTWFRNI